MDVPLLLSSDNPLTSFAGGLEVTKSEEAWIWIGLYKAFVSEIRMNNLN